MKTTGNAIRDVPLKECTDALLVTLDKNMRRTQKKKYSEKRDGGDTQVHGCPGTDAGNHPGVCGAHRDFQAGADKRTQGTEDVHRVELHR